ncbi:MAG: hypothetical protein FD123_4042 [Bacteroidetes bacterium]|nr:MAG: hypothetical protein FD123_4042 [Bacteroidota bacterium]
MIRISRFSLLLILLCSLLAFPSCKPAKVCSGLNPELASHGTVKKVRKARKRVGSNPEREAMKRRESQMKHKKRFSAKGKRRGGGGFFSFIFGGGRVKASGSVQARN